MRRVLATCLVSLWCSPLAQGAERFDVVIAGGSTAAFAAALASAESGARTALLEPTDWVGGQLTASGVPAVDEAWHKVTDPGGEVLNVSAIARDRANMPPSFRAMLDATGNPGRGWVSNYCFLPRDFLDRQLLPRERSLADRLVVYRETVIKRVDAEPATGRIRSLTAIRRTPKPGVSFQGYDRLPSQDLPDWYSPEPSDRFAKEILTFEASVFVEATEWGELLALADASYLQGVEIPDGALDGNDRCGQAIVYSFVQRLHAEPVEEPQRAEPLDNLGFGPYRGRADAWEKIWTYRRLKGLGPGPTPGDLSLQNWGYAESSQQGGNDYPFGYLFLSKADTAAQRADWRGGIDLAVLAAAEQRAFAWHDWFRDHPQGEIQPGQVTLEIGALGTGHGLAKLPYIRDTRRSIGLDDFLLTYEDISGPASRKTGKRFADRVAIGAYPADIHPMVGCRYPSQGGRQTLPFFIPFRALTNKTYGNLLTAGKTMAQSFLANSATRLHPIEWSTGTAAGVAAAHMASHGRTSRQVLDAIDEAQARIREKTPIAWTIDGATYPAPGEETPR
jgi:hypothetical protein